VTRVKIPDQEMGLEQMAAETRLPSPTTWPPRFRSQEERAAFIEERFREIMEALDLDLTDGSLAGTPRRVAEMYVYELFSGLDRETFPEITLFEHKGGPSTISVESIRFTTMCEHHFLPVHGEATVRYIPNGKVVGLSKIHRVVHYFARRPQLQERLTEQIADSLAIILNTEDVFVSLTARHDCLSSRGVRDSESEMTTCVARGKFREI
jgi:GTP cyclohydrolase IA